MTKPLPELNGTPWRWLTLSERHAIVCLVDAEDWDWIVQWHWNYGWHARSRWRYYAKRNVGGARTTLYLHRELMLWRRPDADRALHVDHINNQSLDNRKANLRFVTPKENIANRVPLDQQPSLDAIARRLLAQHRPAIEEVPF